MKTPIGIPFGVGLVTILASLSAYGQSFVRAGSFEVGPFVGSSFGTQSAQVIAGGNITYAFRNKYVLPYFEYSYFLVPVPVTQQQTNFSISFQNSSVSDIHGGI